MLLDNDNTQRENKNMPKLTPPQYRKVEQLKKRAYALYKEGMTMRDIGRVVGRSYTWVFFVVRELSTDQGIDENKQK